jgi:hypothetical protein
MNAHAFGFLVAPRQRAEVFVCALLSACAAVGAFDGSSFHKPDVAYRVGRLGADWQRLRLAGNDLAFHKPEYGTIAANATCSDYEDIPQQPLLNHLLFGTTHRQYVVDEEVTLDGRGTRHAVVDAELDGAPVRLEVYVLTRAGCVFDLSYVSDRSAKARDEFVQFASAFRVEAVRRD